MARGDDTLVVVQGVDLEFIVWVDYKGALSVADKVGLYDTVTRVVDAKRTVHDNIGYGDQVFLYRSHVRVDDDEVVLSDGGLVQMYDYTGLDYFATPYDYVGEQRVF